MKHNPKKRFGQNFLVDFYIIHSIVQLIAPKPEDIIVEIGPGLGALTEHILPYNSKLTAIEIDRDLIEKLTNKFKDKNNFTLYNHDALKFDFSTIGKSIRIIGNLPYNISTPLLFHLINFKNNTLDMHFMLQKELVERITAEPNSKDYGRLSIMMQYHFQADYMLDVPPSAFKPAPKVDSAILRMIPHENIPFKANDEIKFENIVRDAFNKRRKTIQNSLKSYISCEQLEQLKINPSSRPENLTLQEFVEISNYA